jgi:hypothetical protein
MGMWETLMLLYSVKKPEKSYFLLFLVTKIEISCYAIQVYGGWKEWPFMFLVANPLDLSPVATTPYQHALLSVGCPSTSIALADASHMTTALAPYVATPP